MARRKIPRSRDDLFRIWYGPEEPRMAAPLSPFLFALFLISFLYGLALRARRLLFRIGLFHTRELRCPVVSIGNLSVGGTGKTPAVMKLASLFRARGYRPAILSRGYGGEAGEGPDAVSDGSKVLIGPERAGDEPYLMAASLMGIPVITGRNRFLSGTYALEHFGSDLIFLDDAFQHWALKRDFDIVLLNAQTPFGNGFLLPRGPLREERRNLERADAVVLTGPEPVEMGGDIQALRDSLPDISVLTAHYRSKDVVQNGEALPLDHLKGRRVAAFCGLANPDSFRSSLAKTGAEIVSFLPYPDHFRYTRNDIETIAARAKASGADLIVSTEKDGVKLTAFPEFFRDVFVLRIELEFAPESQLTELIEDKIVKWKKREQRRSSLRSSD